MKAYRNPLQVQLNTLFLYLVVISGAVGMVLPFLWMISTALKESSYILDVPQRLIPADPTFENFSGAWTSNNFQLYFKNSLLVALPSVLFVLLFSAMMAYAFARFSFHNDHIDLKNGVELDLKVA